jgi:hypothetical protein
VARATIGPQAVNPEEQEMATDITSRKLIVLKGSLFLLIIVASSMLILMSQPTLTVALAVCALIWASARFYYFLFYVLEKYVDPELRYSGILALFAALWRRRIGEKGRTRPRRSSK